MHLTLCAICCSWIWFQQVAAFSTVQSGLNNRIIRITQLLPRKNEFISTNNNDHNIKVRACTSCNPQSSHILHSDIEFGESERLINKKFLRLMKNCYRVSWFSWWSQIILSVISAVILIFANVVRNANVVKRATNFWISGFAFSSISVILAFISTLWTWNIITLCRKLSKDKSMNMVSRYRSSLKTGVILSLIGMLFALIGAEQIVGNLASSILTNQALANVISNYASSPSSIPGLQPLDIFLVQANTNSLAAHFISIICNLILSQFKIIFDSKTKTNEKIDEYEL